MSETNQESTSIDTIISECDTLTDELEKIKNSVELICSWKPASVYKKLKKEAVNRKIADGKAGEIYNEFKQKLSEVTIVVPVAVIGAAQPNSGVYVKQMAELVKASQVSGKSTLAVLRMQESSAGLGAVFERKYAYAFGFISLYFAIASIVIGVLSLL